jgi:hypothetical protein
MKTIMLISLVAGVMLASGAWADTAQQERMKSCNADAGKQSLSGDARKAFMKTCLSGKKPADGKMTPQERMKNCNADAGKQNLSGDARKAFMKSCLSNK